MNLPLSTGEASRKPRILLVPNVSWWVIGDMAKKIEKTLASEFTFFILPESVFIRCSGLRNALLRHVDVLHVMDEGTWEGLDRLAMPEDLAVVTWIHHVTNWSKWHDKAIRVSHAIVTCTQDWADAVRGRNENRDLVVVPHAIDTDMFSPRRCSPTAFGIPNNRFAVGFAASKASDLDNQRKGLDTLFRVVQEASRDIPNLHLAFCGMGWEDEVKSLRSQGVSASYCGFLKRSDLPNFYSCLDAYLVTSRVEGGPVTVLEAMACETPVVSTRVGLVPDAILEGETGFSTPIDDVAALARGLVALYRHPKLRAKMGTEGRALMQRTRTWAGTLTALADCYRVLSRRSAVAEPLPRRYNLPAETISRAACVADCLVATYGEIRSKRAGVAALRRLPSMLAGFSPVDLARGSWMLANRSSAIPHPAPTARTRVR